MERFFFIISVAMLGSENICACMLGPPCPLGTCSRPFSCTRHSEPHQDRRPRDVRSSAKSFSEWKERRGKERKGEERKGEERKHKREQCTHFVVVVSPATEERFRRDVVCRRPQISRPQHYLTAAQIQNITSRFGSSEIRSSSTNSIPKPCPITTTIEQLSRQTETFLLRTIADDWKTLISLCSSLKTTNANQIAEEVVYGKLCFHSIRTRLPESQEKPSSYRLKYLGAFPSRKRKINEN